MTLANGTTPIVNAATGFTTGATPTLPSNTVLIVIGVIAGALLVPYAARFSPHFVNGLLLIILVGTIIGNSDRWSPWFSQTFSAGTNSVKAK